MNFKSRIKLHAVKYFVKAYPRFDNATHIQMLFIFKNSQIYKQENTLTIFSTTSFALSSGMRIITTESIGFVGSGSGRLTVMVVGVVVMSKSIGSRGSATQNHVKPIQNICQHSEKIFNKNSTL